MDFSRWRLGWGLILGGLIALSPAGAAPPQSDLAGRLAASIQISQITPSAYARGNINAVSMARNALFSVGRYQFAAFYGAPDAGRVPVLIARRLRDGAETKWQIAKTPFATDDVFSNTGARDDHNLIAAAVDKNGILHLSWGMHNVPLTYAESTASVLGRDFAPRGTLAMHRGTMTGRNEEAVTYPEFFHAPDGSLLFAYRDGGAGGGSGNGNEYLNRYDAKEKQWHRVADPLIDGISTSMNAYLNSFAYNAGGDLFASWTIRETPDWTTNHDIYLAMSKDGGVSWMSYDGKVLGKTINRQTADASAKILALPMGSRLINQTSMTIDGAGRPQIASWWSPQVSASNGTRQYMLVWHDGHGWRASQISERADIEANDPAGERVREMGRPLVLTDKAGRTLVVTRNAAAEKSVSDASNRLMVYWSRDRLHWSHAVLSDTNPGVWEPVYDPDLWRSENKLALFFEPAGLGAASGPAAVLTWDEAAFFATEGR